MCKGVHDFLGKCKCKCKIQRKNTHKYIQKSHEQLFISQSHERSPIKAYFEFTLNKQIEIKMNVFKMTNNVLQTDVKTNLLNDIENGCMANDQCNRKE